MYNCNYSGFDCLRMHAVFTNVCSKPKINTYKPVTDGYTRQLYAWEEVIRKPKKSDLEDFQKAYSPMARAQFEQHKIILPDSY